MQESLTDNKGQGNKISLPFFLFFAKVISTSILLLLVILFYLQPVNYPAVDLGRHIKNGEVTLTNGRPISTNYYSYTEPEMEVVNHHWGTGVVFYLVEKLFGINGVCIFYAFLRILAFYLFYRLARILSNYPLAFTFAVLSLPLLISRLDPRPEGFSFLLLAVYLTILMKYHTQRCSWKILIFLPFLQICWVNLHLFFPFGCILVGFFLMDALVSKSSTQRVKTYIILLIILSICCLINPYGIKGVLTPFTILKEYGYQLAENQSVIFMQHRFPQNYDYLHFEITFFIVALGFMLHYHTII